MKVGAGGSEGPKDSSDFKHFFIFRQCHNSMGESQFPQQELKPCPLHWELGLLTTGLTVKSFHF